MTEQTSASSARRDWEERVGLIRRATEGLPVPRLGAPLGLTATPGRGQVTLRWTGVPGAVGYLVRRGRSADDAGEILAVGEPLVRPVPDTTFTDTSGPRGEEAWYRVAAAASVIDEDQPWSEPVAARPRAAEGTLAGDGEAEVRVAAGETVGPLARPWRPMIGSEHLSLLTYGEGAGGIEIGPDLAQALRMAHDELGVAGVRAHSTFHDELGVYREVDGEPRYDFSALAEVYDTALALGVRPIVELGFMPGDLARDPERTVFQYRGIISPPRSYERWGELVTELARFLEERYGRDEVRQWGFEVWNEPNLEVFWSGTQAEYLHLYDVAVRAVKAVDPALRVGGPATAAAGWLDELLAYTRESGAPVDFISTHTYGNAPLDLRPLVERHGYPGMPAWWTEWGAHAGHNKPLNDSVWSAGYVVRGMASAMGRIESLSYWTVSDQFEELGWPTRLFHGGFGLLTVGNLRKPRWWALWMLEQLGPERLTAEVAGDGAGDMVNVVAARDAAGRISVVAWNTTVDSTTASGDALLDRRVRLRLDGLPAGRYRLRHRRLDLEHSNIVAAWERMDGGDWPTDEQWTALRARDELQDLEPETMIEPDGGEHEVTFDLPMPAISLLELTPA